MTATCPNMSACGTSSQFGHLTKLVHQVKCRYHLIKEFAIIFSAASDTMTPNPGEPSGPSIDFSGEPLRASLDETLHSLSNIRLRMDSVKRFLSDSLDSNIRIPNHQMAVVSSEIAAAIRQIIVDGATLLACSQNPIYGEFPAPNSKIHSHPISAIGKSITEVKVQTRDKIGPGPDPDEFDPDYEIVELDAVELLAEHIHFCEICGKGFKRDANLRMHMRAHGNQFKTRDALAKPMDVGAEHRSERTRFSCPYDGCNRNKAHRKFRPLKSVICVKNHFKRSHCPKMFSCNRCNKKSFSVVADLKSHLKNCGESKWRCSCGTTFSRKDKLFGHVALFEGHMPAVVDEGDMKWAAPGMDDDGDGIEISKGVDLAAASESSNDGYFESILDGFGSVENRCLQEVLGFPNDADSEWKFCEF